MEIVVCCEALLDKVEEGLNDVGLYIFAVWGGGGVHQMMFLLLILFVGTVVFFPPSLTHSQRATTLGTSYPTLFE